MDNVCGSQESPATRAIRLLGLIDISHACRVTTDAVRKWSASKGGLIPAQHQARVLRLARSKGVELAAEDVIGGLGDAS